MLDQIIEISPCTWLKINGESPILMDTPIGEYSNVRTGTAQELLQRHPSRIHLDSCKGFCETLRESVDSPPFEIIKL